MKKVKFNIQGMTCSSCSSHVEKSVKNLNGIKNVNVNLLSNTMIAEYDEKYLDDNIIIKAVIDAGYGISVEDKKIEKELENDDGIKSMKKRLIISICFLVPLMYIAMYHMFYEWFGLPIPKIIDSIFSGTKCYYFWIYSNFIITSNCICKQKLFYCRI